MVIRVKWSLEEHLLIPVIASAALLFCGNVVNVNAVQCQLLTANNKKLSYRRETARQLPTWMEGGGFGRPAHSPSTPSGYTCAYGRIRKPQRTYVKRAVH